MKTKLVSFLVLIVSVFALVFVLLHCYQSTEAKAPDPATSFLVEEKPLNTLDPLDPYKDNMQVLTLQDARGCPRVYIRMHRGETFWMDKNGRVFERCKKTGRLVQSL